MSEENEHKSVEILSELLFFFCFGFLGQVSLQKITEKQKYDTSFFLFASLRSKGFLMKL
jgi:hypothetical protein